MEKYIKNAIDELIETFADIVNTNVETEVEEEDREYATEFAAVAKTIVDFAGEADPNNYHEEVLEWISDNARVPSLAWLDENPEATSTKDMPMDILAKANCYLTVSEVLTEVQNTYGMIYELGAMVGMTPESIDNIIDKD